MKMSTAFANFIRGEKGKGLILKSEEEIMDFFFEEMKKRQPNIDRERHKRILETFDQEFKNLYDFVQAHGGFKKYLI